MMGRDLFVGFMQHISEISSLVSQGESMFYVKKDREKVLYDDPEVAFFKLRNLLCNIPLVFF